VDKQEIIDQVDDVVQLSLKQELSRIV